MTDRKPDFYVVKREGLDGAPEWFTYEASHGRVDGIIEFCVPGEMVWSSKRGQLCFDGKMLCRVARPSEVPQ